MRLHTKLNRYLENHDIKELCKDRAVCIFGFVSVTPIIKNNHTIEFVHFLSDLKI